MKANDTAARPTKRLGPRRNTSLARRPQQGRGSGVGPGRQGDAALRRRAQTGRRCEPRRQAVPSEYPKAVGGDETARRRTHCSNECRLSDRTKGNQAMQYEAKNIYPLKALLRKQVRDEMQAADLVFGHKTDCGGEEVLFFGRETLGDIIQSGVGR